MQSAACSGRWVSCLVRNLGDESRGSACGLRAPACCGAASKRRWRHTGAPRQLGSALSVTAQLPHGGLATAQQGSAACSRPARLSRLNREERLAGLLVGDWALRSYSDACRRIAGAPAPPPPRRRGRCNQTSTSTRPSPVAEERFSRVAYLNDVERPSVAGLRTRNGY